MKLIAMKLASLFAAVAGLVLLALLLGVVQPEQIPALYAQYAPPEMQNLIDVTRTEIIFALILVVFGLYGFMPKMPSKKNHRSVSFSGEHGDVVVHLDMVESTLTRVLSNMPEVKKINVRVECDSKGKKAKIVADCVLHDRPEVPAREAADLVNEYLSDAAGNILGVEDIASVKLNITGVEVDAKKSSKFLEAGHEKRVKALEAKRLPAAPGLLAGAAALPEITEDPTPAVIPVTPFAEVEPVEVDTANYNTPAMPIVPSQNADPAMETPFEIPDAEEEKKPENEA